MFRATCHYLMMMSTDEAVLSHVCVRARQSERERENERERERERVNVCV